MTREEALAWLEKQREPEGKKNDDELTWLRTFIEEEAYYLSMDIRDEVDREKLIKLQNALAWLKKQGHMLDPDKVIKWFRKNTCAACWDNPNEGVSQRIEQFKKDFEI